MKLPRTVQPNLSIRKGFDVLEALAFSHLPLTTGQIATQLQIDKSVASRILLTLAELGYVQRIGRGVWRSSTGLIALSLMGLRNSPLVHVKPLLLDLQARLQCIVALGFVWKTHVVYVFHSADSDHHATDGLGHVFPAANSSIGQLLTSPRTLTHKLHWIKKQKYFSLAVPLEFAGFRYGLAVAGPAAKLDDDLLPLLRDFAEKMHARAADDGP